MAAADSAVTPASKRTEGFSGKVTVRSKAAGLPQSQSEARMSAGRVQWRSCPRPLPASTLALMSAWWQDYVSELIVPEHCACKLRRGVLPRELSGHKAQGEPEEVTRPGHRLVVIWCSLGSRFRPRPEDGITESQADAWGENIDRRRAVSAGELSERRENK